MGQTLSNDTSTLATLIPQHSSAVRWGRKASSPRLHGSHDFVLKRPSRSPEYSRMYAPGDPVRMIDWRAYARTDQLIVRETRDESSVSVHIVIDLDKSMWWPDQSVKDLLPKMEVTKAQIALRCAYNLAHAYSSAGDYVSIWLQTDDSEVPQLLFQPRSPSDIIADFQRIVEENFEMASIRKSFRLFRGKLPPGHLHYWFGDGLNEKHIQSYLQLGRHGIFYHVLSRYELNADWVEEGISYFDSGALDREYQGSELKQSEFLLQSRERWLSDWRDRIHSQGDDYFLLSSETSISSFQNTWKAKSYG